MEVTDCLFKIAMEAKDCYIDNNSPRLLQRAAYTVTHNSRQQQATATCDSTYNSQPKRSLFATERIGGFGIVRPPNSGSGAVQTALLQTLVAAQNSSTSRTPSSMYFTTTSPPGTRSWSHWVCDGLTFPPPHRF
jgi:hypothetical protein